MLPLWIGLAARLWGVVSIVSLAGAVVQGATTQPVAVDANQPSVAVNSPVMAPAQAVSQRRPTTPPDTGGLQRQTEPNEPNRACPFTGQIVGNDILVRSGPGTNFYQCAKLFQGDNVEVLNEKAGWSRIVPPVGSFSWIAMQYLGINRQDPSSGIITGEGVGIYAGSDSVEPMHSTTRQAVLRRGDKVKLLGQDKDGYLKIVCPGGSSLWVSSKYIQLTDRPTGGVVGTLGQRRPEQPGGIPVELPLEAQKLKEFYQLQEQFKAEVAKARAEQDFTAIKKPLTDLAGIKDAGKAARYAQLLLERITSCELAKQVDKEVQQQDKQLTDIRARIEKAREKQLAKNPDLGKFSVIGKLQTSSIFSGGPQGKRFRVADDAGKTLCYAEAVGAAASMDLTSFVDQKVGLVGTIKAYPAISGALVEFTEITKIQ